MELWGGDGVRTVEWCYPFTSTIFGGLLNDGLLFGVADGEGWAWVRMKRSSCTSIERKLYGVSFPKRGKVFR